MKKIILIRHAESEANIGNKIFPHDNIIKLSDKGKKQANELSEILEKPDKIIVSKFIRTIETAEPTIQKFPGSEVHLWVDIHEFDPIHNAKDFTGNFEEFKKQYDFFWEKGDPFYKDKNNAESFAEFVDRMNRVILKLKKLEKGINFIFTHGWFIKMFYIMTTEFPNFVELKKDKIIYKQIFDRFIDFDNEFKTQNTGIYDVTELVEKYVGKML